MIESNCLKYGEKEGFISVLGEKSDLGNEDQFTKETIELLLGDQVHRDWPAEFSGRRENKGKGRDKKVQDTPKKVQRNSRDTY